MRRSANPSSLLSQHLNKTPERSHVLPEHRDLIRLSLASYEALATPAHEQRQALVANALRLLVRTAARELNYCPLEVFEFPHDAAREAIA